MNFSGTDTKRVDGNIQIPNQWRDYMKPLPSNYVIAKWKLDSLQRKLDKENGYDYYNSEIDQLLIKGYAEVPQGQIFSNDRVLESVKTTSMFNKSTEVLYRK